MEYILIECPHCKEQIQIFKNEINCSIFRHAVFKDTMEQVNPHLSKDECERLKEADRVFGCCKPFKIVIKDNQYYGEICDYI
jgi:hypothetical protein